MQLIICVHSWLELETTINLDMDVPVVYMVEYVDRPWLKNCTPYKKTIDSFPSTMRLDFMKQNKTHDRIPYPIKFKEDDFFVTSHAQVKMLVEHLKLTDIGICGIHTEVCVTALKNFCTKNIKDYSFTILPEYCVNLPTNQTKGRLKNENKI